MGKPLQKRTILTCLQRALVMEYSDVFLYPRHSSAFSQYPWLVQLFQNFGQAEVRHADLLAREIIRLGGTPYCDFNLLTGKKSIKEIVDWHLKAEKYAVDFYFRCIRLAPDERTGNILNNIRIEETIHKLTLLKLKNWL